MYRNVYLYIKLIRKNDQMSIKTSIESFDYTDFPTYKCTNKIKSEQINKINHSTATCSWRVQSIPFSRYKIHVFNEREWNALSKTRGSWKCWQAWSFIGGSGTAVWGMQICTWKRTSDVMPPRRFPPPPPPPVLLFIFRAWNDRRDMPLDYEPFGGYLKI